MQVLHPDDAILETGRSRHIDCGAVLAFLLLLASPFLALSTACAASSALDLARKFNEAFTEVAEKAAPSVVVIDVIQNADAPSVYSDDEPLEGIPPELWRYLRDHLAQRAPESTPGKGSGVIIREDGYILTNGHVVEHTDSIRVRLKDGRIFRAKLRGIDPQSDLAVIKIDAKGLPAARFADSNKTKVGEFAIAIGAPFDLDYTVTFGHVSAKGRNHIIQGRRAEGLEQDYLQTDALINPGNSGGPLLNLEGEVIGINTMIHGLHSGIGFAVPSNLAREISDRLVSDGKFPRPWLGVELRALRDDPDIRDANKGVDDGLVVARIVPGGPASKSDLERSDIITAVDGRRVNTVQDLRGELRGKNLGKAITLQVYRPDSQGGGRNLKVPVIPAEWTPAPQKSTANASASRENYLTELGITVHVLNPEIAAQFHVPQTNGVLVLAVENGTPAARLGIQFGDVITSVDTNTVATPKQFRDFLKAGDLKKGVSLNLIRDNKARSEVLRATTE